MRIELVVYDFDGVMTNNRVLVLENGTEGVFVNRSDGLAVSRFREMKIKQIILSTETNPVVRARAKKLKLPIIHSAADKKKLLLQYLNKHKINPEQVVYLGNDINDLDAMRSVGWPMAPADAHSSIKKIARKVFKARGGEGVVRELLDLILEGDVK